MVEHDSGLPQEYIYKYDIGTGIGIEHPEGWYYHTKSDSNSDRVCATPSPHDESDYYPFGLSVIVYPIARKKVRNAYREFIETFPNMFTDMKAVGLPSKLEETGNMLSISHEFEDRERAYTVEIADGVEKEFLMPDRSFLAGMTIDTEKLRVYLIRTVWPKDEPEKRLVAEKLFNSVQIQ